MIQFSWNFKIFTLMVYILLIWSLLHSTSYDIPDQDCLNPVSKRLPEQALVCYPFTTDHASLQGYVGFPITKSRMATSLAKTHCCYSLFNPFNVVSRAMAMCSSFCPPVPSHFRGTSIPSFLAKSPSFKAFSSQTSSPSAKG